MTNLFTKTHIEQLRRIEVKPGLFNMIEVKPDSYQDYSGLRTRSVSIDG